MILVDVSPLPERYVTVAPRSYHTATKEWFATVPGGAGVRWNKEQKAYTVPAEVAQVVLAQLEKSQVAKVRGGFYEDFEDVKLAKRTTHNARPYQVDGIQFIVETCEETGSALLADQVGLGKSFQALRAAQRLERNGSYLVICPAPMVHEWIAQAKQHADIEGIALTTKSPVWTKMGVTSWDMFRSIMANKKPQVADVVILDEFHYASNSRAQRTAAVRNYLHKIAPSAFRIALTATPVPVRVRDLHSPLDILWPDRWGSFFNFTRRYCEGHYEAIPKTEKSFWKSDGSSNLEELNFRLRTLMLRRTKEQVKMQLPVRNRIVVSIGLPERAMDGMRMHAAWAQDGKGIRRALSHVEDHKVAHAIGLTKDLVEAGSRVLVFTREIKTAEVIAKTLKTTHVTGQTMAKKRKSVLYAGLADHGCAVATMFSVTEGISLTEFDTIIYVGLDYQPRVLLQTEGRVHRWGATRQVNIYFLVALNTIDEVIRSTVIDRLDVTAKIIGDGDEARLAEQLDDSSDDLLKQIVQQVRDQVSREKRGRR